VGAEPANANIQTHIAAVDAHKIFYIDTAGNTITGSGAQTIVSVTIPGGSLAGNAYRIRTVMRRSAGAGTFKYDLTFGATLMITTTVALIQPNIFDFLLKGVNANSQGCIAHSQYPLFAGDETFVVGATENSAVDKTLLITGTLGTAGDTWTIDFVSIELLRAAGT
jgi:hypothetical protein